MLLTFVMPAVKNVKAKTKYTYQAENNLLSVTQYVYMTLEKI